jgi:cold-inducible RNA-binding protein
MDPLASKDPDVNAFVGNLAFTTTEQDLRQLFESYDTIETVRIITDRETGRSRGFGFVEMPASRAAQSAIDALNGTPVAGRALTVNEARPRESRQPRW